MSLIRGIGIELLYMAIRASVVGPAMARPIIS